MILDYNELQSAFEDLKKITGEIKTETFGMIKFTEAGIEVCYADQNITFNRKIEGTLSEGEDFSTQALLTVVSIKLFSSRLDLFKTSGNIQLAPLEITVDGDSLKLTSSKYLIIAEYDDRGDLIVDMNGEAVVNNVKGMDVSTLIKFYDSSSNLRFSATTRTPYEQIYQSEEGNDFTELSSTWFIELMERMVRTLDAPMCAITGVKGMAFAPGRSYLTKANFDNPDMPVLGINTNLASRVVDIFKKSKSDTVKVLVTNDRHFVKITTGDNSMGVTVVNVLPRQTELATLSSYEDATYDILRMQFNREMFMNLVKTTIQITENGSAASKVQFKYSEADDKMTLFVNKQGSGSAKDAIKVLAENFDGDQETIEGTTMNIVLKVLDQALGSFSTPVIEMRLGQTSNTKVLRIAEIERNPVTQETIEEHLVVYMCV